MKEISRSVKLIKLTILFCAVIFALCGFLGIGSHVADASSTGPVPFFTGAPAFGSIPAEGNCTECHFGTVNSGGGFVEITGLPTSYRPGQVIPVTVKVSHVDAVTYGFQMQALDKNGARVGTLQNQPGNPPRTQLIQGDLGGQTRTYIEHTLSGIIPQQFNFNTWTFNWTAPTTRRGKLTLYAAGNASNSDGTSSGDNIYTTSASTFSAQVNASFDGDAATDISVWRPSAGVWFYYKSSSTDPDRGFTAISFGQQGDKIVPGDYDGDGKTDIAVFRPTGATWFIQQSSTGSFTGLPFGVSDDVPAPGDYDGDGKTDIAVFRPSNGIWFILRSSSGIVTTVPFGTNGDMPVASDYDGDFKSDVAIFRQNGGSGNAEWWILKTSGGVFATPFGSATDKAAQGDYDGDGKTDIAFWRPNSGMWFVLRSTDLSFYAFPFGISTDKIAPGDYDKDGLTDAAVFRDGTWFILKSSDGGVKVDFLGVNGDIPVAAGYLP